VGPAPWIKTLAENISVPELEVWNVCEIGSSPAIFILENEKKEDTKV
jgi:hypothetical protein